MAENRKSASTRASSSRGAQWDQEQLNRLAAEICCEIGIPEFVAGIRAVDFFAHPDTGAPIPYLTAVAATYLENKHDILIEVLRTNGKMFTIYDQHGVLAVEVKATARTGPFSGRSVEEVGAVALVTTTGHSDPYSIARLNANAVMRALTKAKRRAVLRLCLIGLADESELEGIVGNKRANHNQSTQPLEIPEAALEEFQE